MLSHVRHMSSIDKRLMGIVFVDRRYFALALDAVFKQMGKVDRNFGEAVQSNFLTGMLVSMLGARLTYAGSLKHMLLCAFVRASNCNVIRT